MAEERKLTNKEDLIAVYTTSAFPYGYMDDNFMIYRSIGEATESNSAGIIVPSRKATWARMYGKGKYGMVFDRDDKEFKKEIMKAYAEAGYIRIR